MKWIYLRPVRLILAILFVAFILAGCQKDKAAVSCGPGGGEMLVESSLAINSDEDFQKQNQRLHWRTIWELLSVRWATIKYRNIEAADRDGYKTIEVIVQNMGHHFMRKPIVDGKFDVTKPEILVYSKNEKGKFQLVAVEYAVPLSETPDKAPRGFFGDNDVWDRNTTFNLWLLHAWVWYKNPDGVFNPTNSLVHTEL